MTSINSKWLKLQGTKFSRDKISILIKALAYTKEGAHFDNTSQESFSKTITTFIDSIGNINVKPDKPEQNLVINAPQDNTFFYKFISKHTYQNFISKGRFQFGTIDYYHKTENEKIKDDKEGYTTLFINSKTRQFSFSIISGYNYAIFCGTKNKPNDLSNDLMRERFGDYVLKIKNINSFASAVKKAIRSKMFYLDEVKYAETKFSQFSAELDTNEVGPELLSERAFDLLYSCSIYPSLFVKPKWFSDEQELRYLFELPYDLKKPIQITNKGLLDYIEIIKI